MTIYHLSYPEMMKTNMKCHRAMLLYNLQAEMAAMQYYEGKKAQ